MNSLRVLDFITDCFRIAYLYFGTVQTTLGPIVTKIIVPPSSLSKTKKRKRAEKASQDKSPEDTVEEMDNILNKLKLEDVNASNKVSQLWQYGLSSFQGRDTKLDIFLAKNQYPQRISKF